MGIAKKFTGPTTHVDPVDLGEFALWISGGPHFLMWGNNRAESRLAGNVLLWLENGTTYRLEGDLDKGQMVEVARQITR
jgi:hypothetical protein